MNLKAIPRMSAKSGMTLVEAVLAVMVLCIATAGAALGVVASNKVADQARDHYIAENIARNRLEQAKTMSFSNLIALNESNTIVDASGNAPNPISNGRFQRSTTVTTNMLSNTNLLQLVVTVVIQNRVSLAFDTNKDTEAMSEVFTGY